MHTSGDRGNMQPGLDTSLVQLYKGMRELEQEFSFHLKQQHPSQKTSAVNLLHYLYLRSKDQSSLQTSLHLQGLSTFSNSEGYIANQLLTILQHFSFTTDDEPPCDSFTAEKILSERTARLFGKADPAGIPSIMVTFKTSHAHDYLAVKKLLKAGVNIARINCAHDDEKTWLQLVKVVRDTSEFTGLPCKIYMDLPGPKIRTKIKAKKD